MNDLFLNINISFKHVKDLQKELEKKKNIKHKLTTSRCDLV